MRTLKFKINPHSSRPHVQVVSVIDAVTNELVCTIVPHESGIRIISKHNSKIIDVTKMMDKPSLVEMMYNTTIRTDTYIEFPSEKETEKLR